MVKDVSFILHAGGIPEVEGEDRENDAVWFYEWGVLTRPSYTWSGAQNLYDHLDIHSIYINRITSTANLKVGDIISFDLEDDNVFHISHSSVVTRKDGNTWDQIFLTYHSNDRENYSATALVVDSGALPYAWSVG